MSRSLRMAEAEGGQESQAVQQSREEEAEGRALRTQDTNKNEAM